MKALFLIFAWITASAPVINATDDVPVYSVYEIVFRGSSYKSSDNPVRDIELVTTWQNENSHQTLRIYGFYDGDGAGNPAGNIFKVRFCPVEEGTWKLTGTVSNDRKLNGQNEGVLLNAVKAESHGFWIIDRQSPGSRWYKRSDGTHQYITGNTMYSFLSEYYDGKPSGGNIKDDILGNSAYFKKVRIGITGDRYPNPSSKPFLDNSGKPTDNGNFSHRPNPEWFLNRLDLAVKTGFEKDLITDLIVNGPDTEESRSVLQPAENDFDCTPLLKYIAARYGSYPNVWICLSNEFDIKVPVYTPGRITSAGKTLQAFLAYSTPVSVHSVRHWNEQLNTSVPWFDHVILQTKLKKMDQSADNILQNYILGGSSQPVIDDELAYEGAGDGWSEEDVIEAFLGVFAGGGYGSSGHKSANKIGHYFSGNFNPSEHKAADNLQWFREVIDRNITFWKMRPVCITCSDDGLINIFREKCDSRWRIMTWEGREYIVAASSQGNLSADLPEGTWTISYFDLISKSEKKLAEKASGKFTLNFTNSRAQLVLFKRNS